jgi:hypothetical protein
MMVKGARLQWPLPVLAQMGDSRRLGLASSSPTELTHNAGESSNYLQAKGLSPLLIGMAA